MICIEKKEYEERISVLQKRMEEKGLDVFFCYGTEGSYRNLVYLADYHPVFEVGGILVGRQGEPFILNATESLKYAATNAWGIERVRKCRAFDHSENPVINAGVCLRSLEELLDEITQGKPVKRLGLGDYAEIPTPLYLEIKDSLPEEAEIINCDDIMQDMRMNKSDNEIALIREACKVTERAFVSALPKLAPTMTQFEIQGVFAEGLFRDGGKAPVSQWLLLPER